MRRALTAVLTALVAAGLAACTSESTESTRPPEEVLAEAARLLTETSGVELTITSPDFPDEVRGMVGADGIVVRPDSFEGTLTVKLGSTNLSVPVVGIGETVLAEIPFTQGWSDVDPADYGAPDPTKLLDPEVGWGSLLPATQDVTRGESVRGGTDNNEVLTTYTGVVPAERMALVIPGATGDFAATYEITDDLHVRTATFVGTFYPGADALTYVVSFTAYDIDATISLPE